MTTARLVITDRARFEVKFVADGTHDTPAVNFFDAGEQNILLHLVARMREQSLVLNARCAGKWGEEIRIAHDWAAAPELIVRLTFAGGNVSLHSAAFETRSTPLSGAAQASDVVTVGLYGPVTIRRIGGAFLLDDQEVSILDGALDVVELPQPQADPLPVDPPTRQTIDPSLSPILFVAGAGDDQLAASVRWFAEHTAYPLQILPLEPGNADQQLSAWAELLPPGSDLARPFAAIVAVSEAAQSALAQQRVQLLALGDPLATFVALKLPPQVSVLVPAFNHRNFILQRLQSIAAQSFADFEIILLDDHSSDDTLALVQTGFADPRLKIVSNDRNSGSPFVQWRKGLALAAAPYVWIAEGDDFCTPNFLETLVPLVARPGFVMAHARTEVTDEEGYVRKGALDAYLRSAWPGKYDSDYTRDGAAEVDESFAHLNPIVNASGLVLRKSALNPEVLKAAGLFKICGDWLVYLALLRAGSIAYSVKPTNFFRRHKNSAVHLTEGTPAYFQERFEIAEYVVRHFSIGLRALGRMFAEIDNEWQRFASRNPGRQLRAFFDKAKILEIWRKSSPPRRLRIALYVPDAQTAKSSLERLAGQLSSVWARRGHQVDIYCQTSTAAPGAGFVFDPKVRLVPCFDAGNPAAAIPRLRTRLAFDRPDVFMVMASGSVFRPILIAAHGLGFPLVVSEHDDPREVRERGWTTEERAHYFALADGIHLLRPRYRESLPEELHARVEIIQNVVRTGVGEAALAWESWLLKLIDQTSDFDIWAQHLGEDISAPAAP